MRRDLREILLMLVLRSAAPPDREKLFVGDLNLRMFVDGFKSYALFLCVLECRKSSSCCRGKGRLKKILDLQKMETTSHWRTDFGANRDQGPT